jgi:putative endonuclease
MITLKRAAGNAAEDQALDYLIRQKLQLVTRNYSCKAGEIDLIMKDGAQLVFVEVRYRAREDFGSALESVTPTKQRKLITTAQYYLQQSGKTPACRFDVVGMGQDRQIHWVKNAFGT